MLPVPRWMSSLLDLGNCLIKLSDSIFSAIAQNSSCSSLPVIHRSFHVSRRSQMFCSHFFLKFFFCHCLNIPHLLFCLQICGSVLPVVHSIREAVHRAFYLTQWLFSLPVFQFGFFPPVCLLIYWILFPSSVLNSLFIPLSVLFEIHSGCICTLFDVFEHIYILFDYLSMSHLTHS